MPVDTHSEHPPAVVSARLQLVSQKVRGDYSHADVINLCPVQVGQPMIYWT